jgi:integrase
MSTKLQPIATSTGTSKEVSATQHEIVSGHFKFRSSLRVSGLSEYGDEIWSWADPTNERSNSYEPYFLTIRWKTVQSSYTLTDSIISDLKKFTLMRYSHSKEVFWGNLRNGNAHPATIVKEIKTLVCFLRHLRAQLSGDGYSLINNLSDIEVEDLSNALSNYPRKQLASLKKTLIYLSSPTLGQMFDCGPLLWNQYDVKNLQWNIKKRVPYERIADDLFRFLSNTATNDVKQFLTALGIETQDKMKLSEDNDRYLVAIPKFRQLYEDYVDMLAMFRRRTKENNANSKYQIWLHKHSGSIGLMREFVDRVRAAAQLLIAMYTGARRSELHSFRVGCLGQDQDGWFILGTLIKQQPLDAEPEKDKWVAIPIVRDAVVALEHIARLAESRHLFHAAKRHYARLGEKYNSSDTAPRLNKYLRVVDVGNRWPDVQLHLHQFRHTLVFQMRRAGLNLPFITFQLKHYFNAVGKRINDTTIGYGGLESEAATKAIEDAKFESMRQVFHPDAPVAGGGAEHFKARRAAYFEGMALEGHEANDVIRKLAKQGMPLTDVGVGLCQGQKKVVVDGIKSDPPCIGQLRCNPVRCSNGIIPLYKLGAWKHISKENRQRAQDTELAHASTYYEEAADEADAVVRLLESQQVNISSGDS